MTNRGLYIQLPVLPCTSGDKWMAIIACRANDQPPGYLALLLWGALNGPVFVANP